MKQTQIKTLTLSEIKPYFRNPRNNTEAVEKVKESIKQYGYNQLIAVDRDNVIVAGHTRYKALQELGLGEDGVQVIEVDLTPEEAKRYRIIDNKTNEFADWTNDLWKELEEMEAADRESMQTFFTEDINEEIAKISEPVEEMVTETEDTPIDNESQGGSIQAGKSKLVTCPDCGLEFQP